MRTESRTPTRLDPKVHARRLSASPSHRELATRSVYVTQVSSCKRDGYIYAHLRAQVEIHDVSNIKQGGRQDEDGDECYYVHINRTTNSTRRRHRYLFRRSITKLKIKIKKNKNKTRRKYKTNYRSGVGTQNWCRFMCKRVKEEYFILFSPSLKKRERER